MPTISTTKPNRTGYTFKGWYDNTAWNASGAKQYYTDAGASARTWDKTSDATLYAGWQANTTTVSFNSNNATGTTGIQTATVTATFDSNMPAISTTKPTRTGWIFQGWYDNADYSAGTQYYTDAGASARTWNKDVASATLYAGWKAAEITIRWYGLPNDAKIDGVSANVNADHIGTSKVSYDGNIVTPDKAIVTQGGQTFLGWKFLK